MHFIIAYLIFYCLCGSFHQVWKNILKYYNTEYKLLFYKVVLTEASTSRHRHIKLLTRLPTKITQITFALHRTPNYAFYSYNVSFVYTVLYIFYIYIYILLSIFVARTRIINSYLSRSFSDDSRSYRRCARRSQVTTVLTLQLLVRS